MSFLYNGFGSWALAFPSASGTPTASVCLFPGNWSLQILATLLGVDSHVSQQQSYCPFSLLPFSDHWTVSVGSLGPGVQDQVLFEPTKHLWQLWSLILNMILSLLPSCWEICRQDPQDSLGKNTGVGCHFLLHRSLLEKCKSKIQWDITSHQSEWPSSKSLQTINAGKGVEKREPSFTLVEM